MIEAMAGTVGRSFRDAHRAAVLEAMAAASGSLSVRGELGTEADFHEIVRHGASATRGQSGFGLRRWALGLQALMRSVHVAAVDIETTFRAVGQEVFAARIVAASSVEEIVAVLNSTGQHGLADRIKFLHGLSEDDPDEPSIVFQSLRQLALFLVSDRRFGEPQIGLSPEGLLQAEWAPKKGDVLVMNFLPDGMIQFAAVARSQTGGDRSRRVNGTLTKNEALSAVRPFTC